MKRSGRRPHGLAVAAVCALTGLGGCISISVLGGEREPLVESVVRGDRGPKILLVAIEGLILETPEPRALGLLQRESLVAMVREQLDRGQDDSAVRALLLRINSPGGTATASDIIYREILEFKRESGVPVVAEMMGTAASGGYYVAMAADRVIAHPTTVTGSIGVRFASVNVVGLMEKLGIEDQTLVAGDHKDAGSPLRRMTPTERAQIQSILDDLHERFKAVVADGRSELDAEQIDAIADGRIFSATQAERLGLVDGIGYLDDAVAEAERLAGLSESRVVTYHRPREWKQNLYNGPLVPERVELELASPLSELPRPGFLYLWTPGLR